MTEKPGYKSHLVLHAKLGGGGYIYHRQLTDFPGITVLDEKQSYKHDATRHVSFDGRSFDKIGEAVEAWKAAQHADQAGK